MPTFVYLWFVQRKKLTRPTRGNDAVAALHLEAHRCAAEGSWASAETALSLSLTKSTSISVSLSNPNFWKLPLLTPYSYPCGSHIIYSASHSVDIKLDENAEVSNNAQITM